MCVVDVIWSGSTGKRECMYVFGVEFPGGEEVGGMKWALDDDAANAAGAHLNRAGCRQQKNEQVGFWFRRI